jgi:Uma2 family endonuclease
MTSPVEAVSVEAGPVEAVGQALDFTEDFTRELPCEDGIPLENLWHRLQINLLDDCVHQLWRGRTDFYAGGNMFVYYSLQQVQRQDYKGPDFFVVKDVDGSYVRPCWVAWREGGRLPDVIVELLSPSTRGVDLGAKKALYEQVFRTREYFCYGPDPTQGGEPELLGWVLGRDGYEALAADERGWLWSRVFGAWVGEWEGEYHGARSRWLRLYDAEGRLIPTEADGPRPKLNGDVRKRLKRGQRRWRRNWHGCRHCYQVNPKNHRSPSVDFRLEQSHPVAAPLTSGGRDNQ